MEDETKVQEGKIFHLPQNLFHVDWLWLPLHDDYQEEDGEEDEKENEKDEEEKEKEEEEKEEEGENEEEEQEKTQKR